MVSRLAAQKGLDLVQGASGAVLVLFMWVHMFLVSSILLGKDAMYTVTRMLEGEFLFGRAYPALVSAVAVAVLAIFLVHALVAIWKLPGSYRQYRVFWRHSRGLRHTDTSLWLVQVVTGLVLMFTATIHLYDMIMHPSMIGPHASSARVYAGTWPLDLHAPSGSPFCLFVSLPRPALPSPWGAIWFDPAAHLVVACGPVGPGDQFQAKVIYEMLVDFHSIALQAFGHVLGL